ncbi:hypothetical protein Tco_0724727, partial [Tanacetum coccineum]
IKVVVLDYGGGGGGDGGDVGGLWW